MYQSNLKKTLRKEVSKAINRKSETKYRTSNQDEASLSTLTNNIREHTPCRISSGVKENERIGNDVRYTGFDIRGYLNSNSADKILHVRAMAFIDREKQGEATATDQLLLKSNAPVTHAQGAMSAVYAVNKQRYRVLWDRVFKLGPHNQTDQGASVRTFKKFIKTDLKCRFNDESDASITSNDVKVIFWACEAAGDEVLGERVELYSQVIGYYKDL